MTLQTALGYVPSNPNLIQNGGFQVWQRGVSIVNPGSDTKLYTADMWTAVRGSYVPGSTISRQASGLAGGSQYCLRLQRDVNNTAVDHLSISQSLESINSIPLRGRPLTLSFKVRRGDTANQAADALGIYIIGGTGTDERLSLGFTGSTVLGSRIIAPSTSWTTYTITTSSAVGAYTQIGVIFDYVPVGTAGASDYIDITEVKLEAGTVATPFIAKPFAEELLDCMRFFQKTFTYSKAPAKGAGNAGVREVICAYATASAIGLRVNLPVVMRATPTIVGYNPQNNDNNPVYVVGPNISLPLIPDTQFCSESYIQLYASGEISAGNGLRMHATFSAEL